MPCAVGRTLHSHQEVGGLARRPMRTISGEHRFLEKGSVRVQHPEAAHGIFTPVV